MHGLAASAPAMTVLRIGFVLAGVAWISLLGAVLFWHFGPSAEVFGVSTRAASLPGGHSVGSLGKERYLILVEATRLYKEGRGTVSSEIEDGTAFAPTDFLNSELQTLGAKWRVRSTNGLEARIYEIS